MKNSFFQEAAPIFAIFAIVFSWLLMHASNNDKIIQEHKQTAQIYTVPEIAGGQNGK